MTGLDEAVPHDRSHDSWIGIGVSILVGAIIAISASDFLIPASSAQASIRAVWGMSVALTVWGLLHGIRQSFLLDREWKAAKLLRQPDLESALAKTTKKSLGETMTAQHVRTIHNASALRLTPHGDYRAAWQRWRAEQTAKYGGLQRFLASALLLLAVLGTFAGMKSALPELIAAIRTGVGGAGSAASSAENVGSALSQVADAFGANFLALLGSLVLGIAAYGLARERRALLAHVDNLATGIWYTTLPTDAGMSALEQAVARMTGTVATVSRVGDAVDNLGIRLDMFTNTLVDAMQKMAGDMRASVSASVRSADTRHEAQLVAINRNLGLVAQAFEKTAISYEGLVKGLEERDLGVSSAAAELTISARQAGQTAEALERSSERLTELRDAALEYDRRQDSRIDLLLEQLGETTTSVERLLRRQAEISSKSAERQAELKKERDSVWERQERSAAALLAAVEDQGSRLGEILALETAIIASQESALTSAGDRSSALLAIAGHTGRLEEIVEQFRGSIGAVQSLRAEIARIGGTLVEGLATITDQNAESGRSAAAIHSDVASIVAAIRQDRDAARSAVTGATVRSATNPAAGTGSER